MTIATIPFARLTLIAMVSSLAAACAGMVITPSNSNDKTQNHSAPPAILCNIEGKQVQDLSDGTTKATITQSCEETVVFIENRHEKYPKRCRVLIGTQITELYIMPGASRTLTRAGTVEQDTVQIGCINDWNSTK